MKTNTHTLELFPSPPEQVDPAPGASQARATTRRTREGYYNTTCQTGEQLEEYRRVAASQEDLMKAFFCQRPGQAFTPSQLTSVLPGAPLTSVRRAITNLTRQGVLEKTTRQRPGAYQRPEHLWRLRIESNMRDCA